MCGAHHQPARRDVRVVVEDQRDLGVGPADGHVGLPVGVGQLDGGLRAWQSGVDDDQPHPRLPRGPRPAVHHLHAVARLPHPTRSRVRVGKGQNLVDGHPADSGERVQLFHGTVSGQPTGQVERRARR
ncbi:hypothetical protein AFA91_13465 [Mycolicibacterium goodii]|uniref:Uncharacterized protein n=1 Tax=Mycolicibacterium goodii TaxID=134601 RepID=A0A0K0X5G8_MYCGD|nr:hypothetical protein AFA91_13465 [Mycolicibacterium goodii]